MGKAHKRRRGGKKGIRVRERQKGGCERDQSKLAALPVRELRYERYLLLVRRRRWLMLYDRG